MIDKFKVEAAKQIISDYFEMGETDGKYKEGIIDSVWAVLNMPEPPKERLK